MIHAFLITSYTDSQCLREVRPGNVEDISPSFRDPLDLINHNVFRLYCSWQLQLRPHHTFNPKRLLCKDILFMSLSELSSFQWVVVSFSSSNTSTALSEAAEKICSESPNPTRRYLDRRYNQSIQRHRRFGKSCLPPLLW
jgi:hypothetical protein